MMQQDEPDDYILATGETTEVRQFVEWAFEDVGISLEWRLNVIGLLNDGRYYKANTALQNVGMFKKKFVSLDLTSFQNHPTAGIWLPLAPASLQDARRSSENNASRRLTA